MRDLSHHEHHPGVLAVGCHLRITVSARRTDGGRGGYACSYTGGHCLPGDQCNDRRAHQERMAEILRKQAERPIGIKPGKRIKPAGRDALEKERGDG